MNRVWDFFGPVDVLINLDYAKAVKRLDISYRSFSEYTQTIFVDTVHERFCISCLGPYVRLLSCFIYFNCHYDFYPFSFISTSVEKYVQNIVFLKDIVLISLTRLPSMAILTFIRFHFYLLKLKTHGTYCFIDNFHERFFINLI